MSERCPREAASAVAATKMRRSRSAPLSTAYREWLLLLYADFALFSADGGSSPTSTLRCDGSAAGFPPS
jgi:hypothetical protein